MMHATTSISASRAGLRRDECERREVACAAAAESVAPAFFSHWPPAECRTVVSAPVRVSCWSNGVRVWVCGDASAAAKRAAAAAAASRLVCCPHSPTHSSALLHCTRLTSSSPSADARRVSERSAATAGVARQSNRRLTPATAAACHSSASSEPQLHLRDASQAGTRCSTLRVLCCGPSRGGRA